MDSFLKITPVIVNPIFSNPYEQRISLSGRWNFRLDSEDKGNKFTVIDSRR
jgi:hypothetical protein